MGGGQRPGKRWSTGRSSSIFLLIISFAALLLGGRSSKLWVLFSLLRPALRHWALRTHADPLHFSNPRGYWTPFISIRRLGALIHSIAFWKFHYCASCTLTSYVTRQQKGLMSSSNAPGWPPSMHDPAHHQQDFAAAESLLQHSRSARNYSAPAMDGFATSMPPGSVNQAPQAYAMEPSQAPLMDTMSPVQYQTQFNHSFQPPITPQEHVPQPYHASLAPSPTSDLQGSYDHHMQTPQGQIHTPVVPSLVSQGKYNNGRRQSNEHNANGSDSQSPVMQKDSKGTNTSWTPHSKEVSATKASIKQDVDEKPAWSELKTKAGKERKRLPLACIACRRKKIRCSGEKPACKHCQRSRVPCVYKVTTRKAAPRTDYMAMLDRRLKRMEERVIKIIPKEEDKDSPAIPRAVLKPSAGNQSASGKKRAAEEAFGPQLDQWAVAKTSAHPQKGKKPEESKTNMEGADDLPSAEIQEHLSEVFFDCLYGQSYHLLHKPSYMRRLR